MIQITNTLKNGEKNLPEPKEGPLKMFVCGPTVYDYIHIGNARTFVVFDVIAKYLRYRGYDLNYIQNITDIDDRIIKRAQETGQLWKELSEKFEKIFLDNMKSLKVDSVDKYPRATDHIPEIIKQVKTLIEKGNAYLIEGDGYYFDLKTFPEYGKLSGRVAEMAEDAVSRIDENPKKRNRGDFCLWKFAVPVPECPNADVEPVFDDSSSEPSWDFETGQESQDERAQRKDNTGNGTAGRPGWHIEDTAITEKYFGPQYEIHGGGQDLIFPHHEAEIAQQESASGLKPFVKYWLHAGFIVQKGEKMSKSRGVFLTVEDALKKYSPEALRFYFLSAHYRSPLDYTEDSIEQAAAGVKNLEEIMAHLKQIAEKRAFGQDEKLLAMIKSCEGEIIKAMDNDFNTQMAFGLLSGLASQIYQSVNESGIGEKSYEKFTQVINFFDRVFGIILQEKEIPPEVQKLVQEREKAREEKDFARSDELREQIKNLGYEVEDTIYGPLIKKIN